MAADGVGATERLEMDGEKGKERKGRDRKGKEGTGTERNGKDGKGRKREEAAGDERPWLRGRLQTANGCGELRGRLRTAWVQGGGWKWVERRSRW